jgi:hypothetical protein
MARTAAGGSPMKSSIDRIRLVFFGLFIVACGMAWAYQALYIWPKQRCEAQGDWWDDKDRVCAVPMPIWTFTHRMPGEVAPETPAPKTSAQTR